jgi:hypothetical protein
VADFDHDGYPDIVLQNTDGSLVVWYMTDNKLKLSSALTPPAPSSADWRVMGVTDQNGDGWADLLFTNSKAGTLAIWYMNGSKLILGKLLTPASAGGTWEIVAP